ncbi:MAG TPA: hypothetical protein VGE98_11385 [Thermoanaerobaculia bacterium]
MKWLAVWLLLAAVDAAVTLTARRLLAGALALTAEDLVQLAVVPLAQVATLALVTAVRRHTAAPSENLQRR